jgi:MFS family permease
MPRWPGSQGVPRLNSWRNGGLRLHGWRHPAVLACAGLSAAAGFAQFGVTAALADIAADFGEVTDGAGVAAQVGLSGTTIGVGLAIIRAASLLSLPLAATADTYGRRRVVIACCCLGLGFTTLSALSPTYWVFVAVFAMGRPLLSATNGIAGVIAAEETSSADRAKALALLTAGYGIGAGITALLRGVFGEALTFRMLFGLGIVPLFGVLLLARVLEEPDRFSRVVETGRRPRRPPLLHVLGHATRRQLLVLATATVALGFVTGPANTYLFVYAEGVLALSRAFTASVVFAAAPTGLVGLLVGRWATDHIGRRPTAVATQGLVALAGVITYTGRPATAVTGYLLSIFAASAFAPATGALSTELFPTSLRATAAGWLTVSGVMGAVTGLLVFGALADLIGGFERAALVMFGPVTLTGLLFLLLPETRGLELEQTAPDQ